MSKKDNNFLGVLSIESLHHAYLLLGSKGASETALLSLFEKEGIRLKGSPDYFVFKEALLGIDDARALSGQAIRKAFFERKIFFLAPEQVTIEAQNALLKTFEEPIENTHFFLALREESLVLPTLLSRLNVIRVEGEEENFKEAQKFLSQSIKERLNFVRKFVDDERNLSVFLDEILAELRRQSFALPALESVYKLRLVSDDRAASPRLILEHLAVVL